MLRLVEGERNLLGRLVHRISKDSGSKRLGGFRLAEIFLRAVILGRDVTRNIHVAPYYLETDEALNFFI